MIPNRDREFPFTCEQCGEMENVHLYVELCKQCDTFHGFAHSVISVMCEPCGRLWKVKWPSSEELEILR